MRVLYVDCDSLRPDHLGCYGYHRATSPNTDRVAAEGVRFESCFVSDAPCLPSRTALFSGRLGMSTGVVGHSGTTARMRYPGDGHVTDPARLPLPMALSRGGVRTCTISTFGDRHLAWHFCAGWDEIRKFSNLGGNEIATDVEGAAVAWLRENARGDGWFLHVNFWDPHTPYRTPPEFGEPFRDDEAPAFPSQSVLDEQNEKGFGPTSAADAGHFLGGRFRGLPAAIATREDFKRWIDGYDTGIRFFDASLGRLLDTLADAGVLDETAIIISADHGENQGELNLYGSHLTADAITCRVPLIVRWPGLTSPGACGAAIYQLDLAPTLCELLGVEPPAGWDGRSFAAALRGGQVDERPHLLFGQGAWCVQRAVLQGRRLYIRTIFPGLDPMPAELLFDLDSDPHEERNLGSDPDLAALLGELTPDPDPLRRILAEGGPLYPRLARDAYLNRLRETGRTAIAEQLAGRPLAPVVDPFDLTRV